MRRRTPFALRRERRSRSNWISNWSTGRDCVCPPEERLIEPDLSCYRCGGRVVKRVPFNPDDWRAS